MRTWHIRASMRDNVRNGVISAVVIAIIVVIVNLLKTTTTTKEEIVAVPPVNSSTKTVLLWNDFWEELHFGLPLGSDLFVGCKVKNCLLFDRQYSKSDIPDENHDALIFHGLDTGKFTLTDLPLVRRLEQRYIFYLKESPGSYPEFYKLKKFFNWTATYRNDSDFYYAYMQIIDHNKERTDSGKSWEVWREPIHLYEIQIPESYANKSKMVGWLVSNSVTQSKRAIYVNELAKYISVDIYGNGRDLKCTAADPQCDDMIGTNYKFYLAFENSLCIDYVTEKFSRALNHYIVPVVYGGADYRTYAPPLSYIDVKDFASPKELARYLHYLAEHPKEYQKYFWWKQFYRVDTGYIWCDLCKRLHDPEEPKKVVADTNAWWDYPGVCWEPTEHFS